MTRPEIKVFLVCSGLGRVRRGYETFMQACFRELCQVPSLRVRLFKGGGARGVGETPLRHLPRNSMGARIAGEVTGRGSYVIEQVTFALSLLRHIARERPDLIYYCDPSIGKVLWYWRKWTGARYRLLFHNGGPIAPPFPWSDHVQQVTPGAMHDAVAAGHPADRQTLLPIASLSGALPALATPDLRHAERARLGVPTDRAVILSVGALNRGHKRMDYLVREVAALPQPRPYLVMLGQEEDDTPLVRATARLLLGEDGFLMRSVAQEEIGHWYRIADVFVLASLKEGFGLGYVEAMAHGLPLIAHDFEVTRFVVGDAGLLVDLTAAGALTAALAMTLATEATEARRAALQRTAATRFGWDQLRPAYVELIHAGAAAAPPGDVAVAW